MTSPWAPAAGTDSLPTGHEAAISWEQLGASLNVNHPLDRSPKGKFITGDLIAILGHLDASPRASGLPETKIRHAHGTQLSGSGKPGRTVQA